jgi:Tfp pilus assembly protein PilO
MMHRRQKRQLVFAAFLAAVVLSNILFFFILLRPARSDYFNLQGSIDDLRRQLGVSKMTRMKLEQTGDQLERFDQDREMLFSSHFIKFDPGFAELSPRLSQMAVQAGVLRPVVDFGREEIKQYGLYSVKIKIPVQGTYANAVNFIKMLESSNTFFLIENIEVKSNADLVPGSSSGAPANTVVALPGNATNSAAAGSAPAGVALTLALETFFYK